MANTITFKVDGLRQLGEAMREMSSTVANKVSGKATGKAAAIVKKAYKQNLRSNPSVESGLLEKNVIMKKLGKRQTNLTSEHIVTVKKTAYPDPGKNGGRNTRRVGSFMEFGTVKMPAEPALRPAMDQNVTAATEAMRVELAAGIAKAAKP